MPGRTFAAGAAAGELQADVDMSRSQRAVLQKVARGEWQRAPFMRGPGCLPPTQSGWWRGLYTRILMQRQRRFSTFTFLAPLNKDTTECFVVANHLAGQPAGV